MESTALRLHYAALRTNAQIVSALLSRGANQGLPELNGSGVLGDGLKHLAKLTKLAYLNLNLMPLADGAVEHLKILTGLKECRLALPQTKIPQ